MIGCIMSSYQLQLALFVLSLASSTTPTRVILDEKNEPNVQECHHIYRTFFANDAYWSLAHAGLLTNSSIPDGCLEPADKRTSKYAKTDFKFNSSKYFNWQAKLEYMLPIEERLALHTFDDERDVELASGPQVDQNLCSLHLAYMERMIDKRLVNLKDSTDYSLFRLMLASDGPNFSVGRMNTMFLGNYDECVSTKLSIERDDLFAINQTAADTFFASPQLESASSALLDVLGPLIGWLPEPRLPAKLQARTQGDKMRLVNMRYCMAGLRYAEWRNDTFSRRNMNFRVALCLPESCDSRSLSSNRDRLKRLVDFNVKQYFGDFYLSELYCLPDEQSALRNPWNFADSTIFLSANALWLGLVVLATTLHLFGAQHLLAASWWRYLSSWSLPKNYAQLMASSGEDVALGTSLRGVENSPAKHDKARKFQEQRQQLKPLKRVDLKPMEGFKVLSAIAVMASHASMIIFSNNWNPADGHKLLSRTWISLVNTVFPAVVDNFFVATGILTAITLSQMPRKQLESRTFWPIFIIHRYLRIVPLYALVHWFIQTYFRFLGAGPKWDYGTSRTAWMSMCRQESLWTLIVPSANFKSAKKHCNHVGWYLANDMQFSLFVPVLSLFYSRSHKLGHTVLMFTCVLVCANHIRYYLELEGLDARSVFEPSMMMLAQVCDEAWAGYVMPQYRCLAFLVGFATGQLLIKYDRGEKNAPTDWPRWLIVGGKLFIAANAYLLCLMPFLSYLVPLHDEQLVRTLGALLSGSMHGITSLAAAFFMLFLCTGHLPLIGRLSSLDFLKPLAKMSLSSLLVHIPLQYYHSQSLTYLPQLSRYNLLTTTLIWCLESYVLALVVYLVYELPLRKILVKILLGLIMKKIRAEHSNDSRSSLDQTKDQSEPDALDIGDESLGIPADHLEAEKSALINKTRLHRKDE